jgi:hypothetical protein
MFARTISAAQVAPSPKVIHHADSTKSKAAENLLKTGVKSKRSTMDIASQRPTASQ